ncbi:MAG: hypothetical protein PF693_09640 [Spirochaetia bacterium]|jgi:hypothetical protein|nr:hypothetical protein [Spirochaetia bacterium]
MRRYIFILIFILISVNFTFSQEEITTSSGKSENYFYQLSLGSSYSVYFYDIQTVLDSMDEGTLSRIPLSMDLLFGNKISNTIAWTISLTSSFDSFSSTPDYFQMYNLTMSAGYQYIPFQTGLFMGLNFGINMLIPNTTLDYIGDIEFGSNISFDIGYFFESLKFTKAGIIPGLGLKLGHSEMKRGSVDQISGYINLGIR